jgi:DMSO/TMAO reductase YedYZ molybdopterin-dependent catalytic subunit
MNEEVLRWADVPEPPSASVGARFTDLAGLDSLVVPADVFFVLSHGRIPRIRAEGFRLRIEGSLARSAVLGLDEIRSLPATTLEVAFECAGNGGVGMHGLVGNAELRGAPLRAVLEPLGVGSSAREVVFEGADEAEERLRGNSYPARFARSLPLKDALDESVLLAYEMNGEPLSPEHGFPLRLVVPGWYGVAQVKWLSRIEVLDSRFMGWFMAKDYVTVRGEEIDGRIEHRATSVGRQRLKSLVTRVTRSRAGAAPPEYFVRGLVWNDGAPLLGVEVSIDEGPFAPAAVAPRKSRFAWTSFRLKWEEPAPGRHRLVSRARDAKGSQPTEEEASRFKATPWENDGQVVREIVINDP